MKKSNQSKWEYYQLKRKNWDKNLEMISFDTENPDYYENKPIKPGFWFWKNLVGHLRKLKKLNLRIPKTLVVLGSNNYIYLRYDEKMKKVCFKTELDISLRDFERDLEKDLEDFHGESNPYLMVSRSPSGLINEMNKSVFKRS